MSRVAILVFLATLTASVFVPSAFDQASLAASGAASFDEGYVCYRGQFSGFRRAKPIVFRDVLAGRRQTTFRVGSPYSVCAPATSGLLPPAKGYLVCYPTPAARLGVARRLATKVLGDLRLPRVSSLRDLVCVESNRLDQRVRFSTSRVFICYRSGMPRTGDRTVRVRDAFRRTEDAFVGVPYRGCAAAPSLIRGASYLVCSPISSGRPAGSVVLRNRFGYVKAVLGSRATLCVKAKRAR